MAMDNKTAVILLNYVPNSRSAKSCPRALFTPLPVAAGTGQNRKLSERLAEILYIGASISWDWN